MPIELELQSELDLALTVACTVEGIVACAFGYGLAERTVACVGIGTVKEGPVEGVEVVHLQNGLNLFANVEVLSGVDALIGDSRRSNFSESSGSIGDDVLVDDGEAGRVEDGRRRAFGAAQPVVLLRLVGMGLDRDRGIPERAIEAVGERRAVLTDAVISAIFIVHDPAHLPAAGDVAKYVIVEEFLSRTDRQL